MKIKNWDGMFWNAENNCWTVAESAATEYNEIGSAPQTIGDLDRDVEHDGYYASDEDDEPTATLVK